MEGQPTDQVYIYTGWKERRSIYPHKARATLQIVGALWYFAATALPLFRITESVNTYRLSKKGRVTLRVLRS